MEQHFFLSIDPDRSIFCIDVCCCGLVVAVTGLWCYYTYCIFSKYAILFWTTIHPPPPNIYATFFPLVISKR